MRTHRFVTGALTGAAVFLSASISMAVAVSAGQTPSPPGVTPETRLLSSLNSCIQARFQEIDFKFGISRVLKPGATPHRFEPGTVREISAVRDLEDAGLRVVLYLTGRQILRDKPQSTALTADAIWALIKGPVLITQVTAVDNPASSGAAAISAPAPMDLWNDSRRAMLSFAKRESHEFAVADWNFVARPVRATSEMCLNCHREATAAGSALKIGDPLGVVLYGYTRK
jgi:hypothetical protein